MQVGRVTPDFAPIRNMPKARFSYKMFHGKTLAKILKNQGIIYMKPPTNPPTIELGNHFLA